MIGIGELDAAALAIIRQRLDEVFEEYRAARRKFRPARSAHEGYAILAEELDELWEVVRLRQDRAGRDRHLVDEARQVAAMALAIMVEAAGYDQ